MWTLLVVVLSTAISCRSNEIGSYDYDNKIEETTSTDRDNLTSNVYVLPDQIFNDGKPFFVKKDASGTIDFNAKTTPESLPVPTDAAAIVSTQSTAATAAASTANIDLNSTRKHDISLDHSVRAQNIHDYLNLPVKYQSSKFVYPVMSSSYANLKYQGNNKNYISNHKFDSSTVKSVPYTTKKYRPTYSTKSYALSKHSTTESYDSSTKATPITNGTRKYSSIPPRSSTPNRRFSTLNRLSSTTPRPETKFPQRIRSTTTKASPTSTTTSTSTTTTTEKPIEKSDDGLIPTSAFDSDESFASISGNGGSTTISPKNATESEPDAMGLGDFFSYFFNNNNEESEETVATRPSTKATPSTTVMTLRPVASTTRASIVTKVKDDENTKPHNTRYNMTLGSVIRRPFNRTSVSEHRTTTTRPTTASVIDRVASASTATPQIITQYGDKPVVNTGNFRPPASMESIRVSHGAQTASFITNGQIAANNNNVGSAHHSYNGANTKYKGQFQPPAQNDMKNIVVLPESNSASFVATSQLQTTTRFDQKSQTVATAVASNDHNTRRPITTLNTIDETTKPGIQFFQKGHVTSAEAYDHPNQSNVVFNGPSSSNSNNVVIAPGTNTASFVTTSQMSMGLNQHQQQQHQHQHQSSSPQDQKIKSVESEINAYSGPGLQASQRPHGFQLPPTTAIPKQSNQVADNSETQAQQIRFPIENSENAGKSPTANGDQQPESAPLTSTNNTIKFPSNQQQIPANSQVAAVLHSAPATEGLVKFTDVRNEITDGIDPNNYKQILQAPNSNYVVFRPQSPPIAMVPQAPLVMGLSVPQLYRNPAFVFKKPTIVHYPRKNYTLPNILPQFRPTQQQHQQQQVLQQQIAISPEAIAAANQLRQSQLHRAQYLYNAQNLRYKSPMQILFNQRPMQIRPALDQTQTNRRHFELHPHPGNLNRIYERPMLPHIHNRNVMGANTLLIEPQRFEENMKVPVANGAVDMDASKNPDFENGDAKLVQQQQQQQLQPIVESQKENEAPKVEPVTTLQRLLQQKTGATNAIHHGLLSVNRNTTSIQAAATDVNSQTEKPLYVVYPMQKNPMGASNRGGNGEISTILAEQMQHKPATIQQHGLPYTLEKHKSRYILNSRPASYEFEKKSDNLPDPIAAENDEEDGDRPVAIAIAYSPTEPNPSHLADIYRPTPAHQAPHAPIYRHTADDDSNSNANQQFQAPFIPSINLENTQSTHNGWSIVTPPSILHGPKNEAKVNRISASLANSNATSSLSISRSDSGETAEEVASVESTTRKFDFDHFKPEFQSGFMPIYKSAPSSLSASLSASSSSLSSASAPASDTSIAPAAPIPPEKQSETMKTQSDEKSTDRSDNFNLESLLYDDDEEDNDNDEETEE